eukprot:scaffold152239_cov32-Tisochrysis_lutea.AAC.2
MSPNRTVRDERKEGLGQPSAQGAKSDGQSAGACTDVKARRSGALSNRCQGCVSWSVHSLAVARKSLATPQEDIRTLAGTRICWKYARGLA